MMSSTNPFPQLTSTTILDDFPPSNSLLNHEKDDLYINNLDSFLTSDCFPTLDDITPTKQDLVEEIGLEQCDENDNLFWSVVKNNKASNKDHHSKIHTAQGPRDRRVRLSIEVAKRFFYLQDLLGFDKGSKTLDWLFKQSKNSIDELIKSKKESSSSTLTDQSEVVFLETDEQAKGRKKKCVEGNRKKPTRKNICGSSVNQSRIEARARARERTLEKQNLKKLDNYESKSLNLDCCSSNLTLHQSSLWNSVESQNDYSDKISESLMEDNYSMLYSYQHNLAVSNDSSSEFNQYDSLEVLVNQEGATKFW